jgi:hypothetical protein
MLPLVLIKRTGASPTRESRHRPHAHLCWPPLLHRQGAPFLARPHRCPIAPTPHLGATRAPSAAHSTTFRPSSPEDHCHSLFRSLLSRNSGHEPHRGEPLDPPKPFLDQFRRRVAGILARAAGSMAQGPSCIHLFLSRVLTVMQGHICKGKKSYRDLIEKNLK